MPHPPPQPRCYAMLFSVAWAVGTVYGAASGPAVADSVMAAGGFGDSGLSPSLRVCGH